MTVFYSIRDGYDESALVTVDSKELAEFDQKHFSDKTADPALMDMECDDETPLTTQEYFDTYVVNAAPDIIEEFKQTFKM